jgi:hypothetical protein
MRFPQASSVLITVITFGSQPVDRKIFFRNQAEEVSNHEVVEKVNADAGQPDSVNIDDENYWKRFLEGTMSATPTNAPNTDPCNGVICPEGDACDPLTGECLPVEEVVPCVGIIDEWDNDTPEEFDQLWSNFRAEYLTRPFCLLTPLPQIGTRYM